MTSNQIEEIKELITTHSAKKLNNFILCLCECMGMQAENNLRTYRGESPAYHEIDFLIVIEKAKKEGEFIAQERKGKEYIGR